MIRVTSATVTARHAFHVARAEWTSMSTALAGHASEPLRCARGGGGVQHAFTVRACARMSHRLICYECFVQRHVQLDDLLARARVTCAFVADSPTRNSSWFWLI